MVLRLVDGGIPSFEWKMKRVELPFSEVEKTELQLKIELGERKEKVTFKKRYVLRDDQEANLERYRKLIRKIPALPGKLVIGTVIAGNLKVLNVFSSDTDLREEFRKSLKSIDGVNLDRFNWLKKLTKEDGYSSVCFLIGRED
jgi:hypothetical protein